MKATAILLALGLTIEPTAAYQQQKIVEKLDLSQNQIKFEKTTED